MAVLPAPGSDEGLLLPSLVLDPVWALRPWPVTVSVAHDTFTIPALPAVDWLAPLMSPELDLDEILPGLLAEEEQEHFEDLLFEGAITVEETYKLALEAVELCSSRKWWVTLRLIGAGRAAWDHIGFDMAQVDATRLPLAAWVDVLYYTLLNNMKPDSRTMFLAQLEMVPPELVEQEAQELEMTPEAFLRLAE